ncbi:MAG: GNAT family N-acetyltransferase [Thiothrix sp.]
MTALYAYIQSDFNSPEQIVLPGQPHPPGLLCTDIPFMPAPYLDLPSGVAEFEAMFSNRFWKEIRRRYRMLERHECRLEFMVVSDAAGMQVWLPRARQVFLKRWEKHYTSCLWTDDDGFALHLRSAARLADSGQAQLVLLLMDGVVVTYALTLLDDSCCYIFHHAALMDEKYKPYALGRLLFDFIIRQAINQRLRRVDFMQGEGAHKALWTSSQRMVRWRVTSPQTILGYLLHGPRVAYYWLRVRLQNQLELKLKVQYSIVWLRDFMAQPRASG